MQTSRQLVFSLVLKTAETPLKQKSVNAPYKVEDILEDRIWQSKTCVFITFYFLLHTTFMYILSPLETGCIEEKRRGDQWTETNNIL